MPTFLRYLPLPVRATLRAVAMLALSLAALPASADDAVLKPGTMQARAAACTACHGEQGRAGGDGYYPRIAGKPQEYLYHQLLNFRDGRRQYRPMAHLLQNLPDDYLHDIAVYFADQHPPYADPQPAQASAATLEKGRLLTVQGDPARNLPACASCHGANLSGMAPGIPGLLGLPRDYILAQIGSWKNDQRRAAAPDCMARVAQQMTPEDIAAVATWLSARPVIEPYVADPAGSRKLPAECGSQTQR
jgi:cytochrome c553